MSGARQNGRVMAHSVVAILAGIIAMLAPTIPARAQSIAGEAGGFAESGSVSLSNALAGAALDPSTGVLTASLPIEMPPARGSAQPGLALTYNSAAGIREAGVGWGLALASVERQNIDGPPRYRDPTAADPWPAFDRFVFGGLHLIPICRVKGQTCVVPSGAAIAAALPLPAWATEGWVHFRLQTDTSRARFYWSPDLKTWRVQFVGGETLELGQPLVQPSIFGDPADAAIDYDAIRTDAAAVKRQPFRWNVVRRYDSESQRVGTNLVVYRWARLGQRERGFLSDVYDTPATDALANRDKLTEADFAHHARLSWDRPPFLRGLALQSFRATPDLTLAGVDITSQPFDRATRQMVRRYRLSYQSDGNRYYLSTYEVEGRCAIVAEGAGGQLPTTSCVRLPATRLRYSPHLHNTTPTSFGPALPHAPRAPAAVTLLDVDGDGRPDLLETKDTLPPSTDQRLIFNRSLWPQTKIAGDPIFFSRNARTTTGPINVAPTIAATAMWNTDPTQSFVGGAAFATASRDAFGSWTWVNGDGEVSLYADHVLLPGAAPVPPSVVGDVDGDGLADAVYLRSARDVVPGAWPSTWKQTGATTTVSMGALTKVSAPWPGSMYDSTFAKSACFGPSPNTVQSLEWVDNSKLSASLVDMNGDGFGDLTYVTMTRTAQGVNLLGVRYWPGDGRGNFTACTTDICPCTGAGIDTPSVKFTPFDLGGTAGAKVSAENVTLGDVNGDGFADLVVVTPDDLRIYWNADGRYWGDFSAQSVTIPGSTIASDWKTSWPPRISFADVNGNGLTDVVLVVGGQAHFFDSQDPLEWVGGPTRAGLLVGIENGLGATTDIAYTSTAQLARVKGSDEHPWALPQVVQVVEQITVASGIAGDDAQYALHDYDNPVYDSRERRFLGFRNVRISTNLVSTEHRYFIGDSNAAYQGSLLISSAISDKNGHYLSAVVRSPLVQDGIAGALGGYSRAAYDEKVDTIIYDTNAGGPAGGTTFASVLLGRERIVIFFDGAIPIWTAANARLRVTQRLDDRGNVVEHVDVGRIDEAERPIDDPVVRTTVMYPARGDGKSLPKSVTVAPFVDLSLFGKPADQPRARRFEYDALGRLEKVFATLTGTLALDRSHEDMSKDVAKTPASASHDGEILALRHEHDDVGNVTLAEGPNGHCTTTTFDKSYGQLPQRAVAFTGGCGGAGLENKTKWDRGFATVTSSTAPDLSSSYVDLDAFGRVVATHAPDPVSGAASPASSSRIEYQITPGGPVQRVKIETAASNGAVHTSWIYSDGFGRRLLTFEQADPAAGDAGDWVVSGLPERSNGLVMAVHEPWFYTGAPADHPLSTPTTPSRRFSYDAFGRVVSARAIDGTTTLRRVYRPLATEDTDAAGRVTINRLNGHRRIYESVIRTADDELTTRYAYQSGGELAYVGQTHANDPVAVVRWLQYDSLGRNVLNAEPNTAKNFGSPASSANMRAWRYAYDDAGQLVGTSDARGCGKNIFYDSVGRSVAEDFSPCLSSQEGYSEYNPLTGENAEVLRTYDAPEPGQTTDFGPRVASLKGRLAATRDRAAHTRFGYDGRGRLVDVARQIARPAAVGGGAVAAAGALAAPLTARGLADRERAKERASLLFCVTLAALLLFFRRARRPGAVAADRLRRGMSVFATAAALALFTTACGGSGDAALGHSSGALTDAGYEATWARSAAVYDDANRIIKQTTGADVPELLGTGGESAVTFAYTSVGSLRTIGGSYGDLVAGETHDADGLPRVRAYADAAATSVVLEYDERRRLRSYTVARPEDGPWTHAAGYSPPSTTPSTLQGVLVDNTFAYDLASNPSFIDDRRPASAWPEGFAPVARTLRYDSFDRIARVDNAYKGVPTWRDPLAVERAGGRAPVPSLVAADRVGFQTFEYDWRGNLTSTADDANLFYDRSLGVITLGTTNSGPDQLRAAGTGLTATHDDAGNLVDVVVQRPGTCTDAGGCVQRFHYDWDEVGQLSRARRWDYPTIGDVPALPTIPLAPPATTDLRYVYDEGGSRVLKRSVVNDGDAHYTAEILPSLRLELATWDDVSESYARTASTEIVYLAGVGRVVHGPTLPSATGSPQHVFLMLPDHLGSTAAVIDRDTGELVERTTQQPYGAPDSDYRPDRWSAFREPYQFTGKEDDIEVGLTYFGARYYHAALGRFASADPLAIHALGGDGNPYAYVRGAVFSATDPFGLACDGSTGAEQCPDGTTNGGGTPPIDFDWLFGGGGGGGGGGGSGPGVLRGSRGGGSGGARRPSSTTIRVMSGGLNPTQPVETRWPGATLPDGVGDTDVPLGTRRQFIVGLWNAVIKDAICSPMVPTDPLTKYLAKKYLLIEEDADTWMYTFGHIAPMVGMAGAGGFGAGAEALESEIATAAAEEVVPVVAGEAGQFAALDARGVVADGLTPHHMPQAALEFTSRADGGALVMEHGEHALTRTYFGKGAATARAEAGMSFRDVLARDMRDVRRIVGPKYDPGLRALLKYYKARFPTLMAR